MKDKNCDEMTSLVQELSEEELDTLLECIQLEVEQEELRKKGKIKHA